MRRSTRVRFAPENLSPDWKGKSYVMKHRSGKASVKCKVMDQRYNLYAFHDEDRGDLEYSPIDAVVLANYMFYMNVVHGVVKAESFGQQHQLSKGLKLFGEQGREAAHSEIGQLHNRQCFKPLSVNK